MEYLALLSKVGDFYREIIEYLSDTVWLKALQNIFAGLDLLKERNQKGLYEVLIYEAALEFNDRKGKKALVTKYEKVKYLQDNNIAYQDQA